MGLGKNRSDNKTENPVAKRQKTAAAGGILGRMTGRDGTRIVTTAELMTKGAVLVALGLVVLMAIAFAVSSLLTQEGAFSIRTGSLPDSGKVISLSETEGFSAPTVKLSAVPIESMDNITYDWLPLEELEARDGAHNGENYICYTFYLKNTGTETLDYQEVLNLEKASRNVDEAVRVMIFRNGKPTVYAQKRADGGSEAFPNGVQDFAEQKKVTQEVRTGFKPGETDRYTVVVWLEGEDPECVDAVREGVLRLGMDFNVLDEDVISEDTVV